MGKGLLFFFKTLMNLRKREEKKISNLPEDDGKGETPKNLEKMGKVVGGGEGDGDEMNY